MGTTTAIPVCDAYRCFSPADYRLTWGKEEKHTKALCKIHFDAAGHIPAEVTVTEIGVANAQDR